MASHQKTHEYKLRNTSNSFNERYNVEDLRTGREVGMVDFNTAKNQWRAVRMVGGEIGYSTKRGDAILAVLDAARNGAK